MNDKLRLAPNQWVQVKKKYDKPFIGNGKYGEYYTYTFDSKGEEVKFFADEKKMWCLEEAQIERDEEFQICSQQKAGAKKKIFWVKKKTLFISTESFAKTRATTYRNNIIEATANRLGDKFDKSQFEIRNANGTIAPSTASTKGSGNGEMTKGDWELKEMRITKLAIIKSLIEAGYKPAEEGLKALEFWFDAWQRENLIEKQKDMEAFSQSNEPEIPEPKEEKKEKIKSEDLPF